MLSIVSSALSFNVGSPMLPMSALRAPAVSMAEVAEEPVYEAATAIDTEGLEGEVVPTAAAPPPAPVVEAAPAKASKGVKPLFDKFVYGPTAPVSANFAANMGDSAQLKTQFGDMATKKPRIAPMSKGSVKASMFSDFVDSRKKPLKLM